MVLLPTIDLNLCCCLILLQVMETAPGPCAYYPSYGYGQSYCNYTSPYITGQFVVEVGDPMPQYVSYPQYEQPLYPALSSPANFPIQSSVVAAANTPARPPVSGADTK